VIPLLFVYVTANEQEQSSASQSIVFMYE